MTKAEFLAALAVGPDDAEVVVADYIGEDMEIGRVVYFARDKLFWIQTADLVAEEDDEVEDESVEAQMSWENIMCDAGSHCGAPTEPPAGPPLPAPQVKPKGRQRAA